MRTAFDGFDPAAWQFLDGLAADNTKRWFDDRLIGGGRRDGERADQLSPRLSSEPAAPC
jgi:hypothetical protein